MKKVLLILSCVIISFVACNKDNEITDEKAKQEQEKEDSPEDKLYSVRYEASVIDSVNYQIRVLYVDEKADVKEIIVDSPFIYEMDNLVFAYFVYLSVMAVPKNATMTNQVDVTAKLFIDDKLFLGTQNFYVNLGCILGVSDPIQTDE